MKQLRSLLVGLILASAVGTLPLPGLGDTPLDAILPPHFSPPTPSQKVALKTEFGRLPLSFEPNQGQADARVRFLTHTADSTLFLTPSEAVFKLPDPLGRADSPIALHKDHKARFTAESSAQIALRMQIVGANPKASAFQLQPLAGRINYFIGKDPSKWHAGVPTFGRVGFHQVYPGIDMVYYGNQRNLEYDFRVAPHADPKQITLHFEGAQGVRIDAAGDLLVRTESRDLKWQKPTVYQQDAKGKHAVSAHFYLIDMPGGQAGIRFALGLYNSALPLVIDPVLFYSTYLGGSRNAVANGIAIDSSGNAYVAGYTIASDFPTTSGALQRVYTPHGGNAFITKLNATGEALVYSTYLGGSSGPGDGAVGIAIDSSGNAYVTGYASANDFPTTPGAFQTVNRFPGFNTPFLTKLNADGSALVYSTYLGGSSGDQANSIAIDGSGNAYITGWAASRDFPVTPGAFQTVYSGIGDIPFITKLNAAGTALIYSTYLGGGYSGVASGIAVDSSGNAYVVGNTASSDFPTTPNAFQTVNRAHGLFPATGFVTKLNAAGTALLYSTYLGGSGEDGVGSITVDDAGNAYVIGSTTSTDFPITPGAFQRTNIGIGSGYGNLFVTKLNPTGSALLYSTYLGGSGGNSGDAATGIAIDSGGNAYITGRASSKDFPTTLGAYQRLNKIQNTAHGNAFITKLNANGTLLLYSTFLGGYGGDLGDQANGIAIDGKGNAYVAGYAYSYNFPTTSVAFQRSKGITDTSVSNAFVTRLSTLPIYPDVNNDGYTDLFLQNTLTGAIASSFMRGSRWLETDAYASSPSSDYALIGAGDFKTNGGITLVFQSRTTNRITFSATSGTTNGNFPDEFLKVTPDPGWKLAGVGDFNLDGKSDLVFQNQTDGRIAIWFMNGYLYNGGVLLPFVPLAGWTLVGTGDFNSDGLTDLVFQNQTTGQLALWFMNGTNYAGGMVLTAAPAAGWKVVGVGDYNGDGSADLLFQNPPSSQAVVWYLKNGALTGGEALSLPLTSGWKIVGPR